MLLSPILDLQRHIESEEFIKALSYINRFLPGSVKGIDNIPDFIKMTKKELSKKDHKIEKVIQRLKNKELKVITGGTDKITPVVEVERVFKKCNISPQIIIIDSMEHESIDEEVMEKVETELKNYFNI